LPLNQKCLYEVSLLSQNQLSIELLNFKNFRQRHRSQSNIIPFQFVKKDILDPNYCCYIESNQRPNQLLLKYDSFCDSNDLNIASDEPSYYMGSTKIQCL
jgi:hypothetical protein